MTRTVLVINCGSSSLKFALYNQSVPKPVVTGLAEALSTAEARIKISHSEDKNKTTTLANAEHGAAIEFILTQLESRYCLTETLMAVGHRVVHGGEAFSSATLITDEVLSSIQDSNALAPLHNPANILGIELLQQSYPNVAQVAVFDTAFHQTMPDYAYHYALPRTFYDEHAVRRYGFHGTSHHYVGLATAKFIEKPFEDCSFVSAHLGNGASVCAINKGKSVDTSMGMTPLEGLVMGTRSGDIDPGIFSFLLRKGFSGEEIDSLFNKKSGLLGISGVSNDMRTLEEHAEKGNSDASLAVEIFCFRLAKYIAAMLVSLDNCDGLIFTGGIGENSSNIRAKTLALLNNLGFEINETANKQRGPEVLAIHLADTIPVYVTKTDEEFMIASQSAAIYEHEQGA